MVEKKDVLEEIKNEPPPNVIPLPMDGVEIPVDHEKAEEYKKLGNDKFINGDFKEAEQIYTQAINIDSLSKKAAIYYSNRAFCLIKLEYFSAAIIEKSIELDPTYVKAYYRRGSAHFVLNHLDKAVSDFKKVTTMYPHDQDAKKKYQLVKKEKRLRLFAETIEIADEAASIKIEDIKMPAGYSGPKLLDDDLSNIGPEFAREALEYMQNEKILPKKYIMMILLKLIQDFKTYDSLVSLTIPSTEEITVCGDVHGQYYDLLNIMKMSGEPSNTHWYLFNGDFVDRGSFSVECIVILLIWKIIYPNTFHLNRGNHETKSMNSIYGFRGEVLAKYDQKTFNLFQELFHTLPLGYCLNKKILVLHGGLFSKDGVTLEDIRKVNRFGEPGESGIFCEALWSDPVEENGRHLSKRGVGLGFGPDISAKFLDDNGLDILVRSHEMKDEGYEWQKGNRVVTVFSAPCYCDTMKNKGAFITFKGHDMKPKFTKFEAVQHPKKPAMAYASPFMMM